MIRKIWYSASLLFLVGIVSVAQDAQFTEQDLEASEQFIDAFYSFSPERLRATLQFAEPSMASIIIDE